MTGQLRTTLHERADHLTTWDADLDRIVRDGERRVRRRKVVFAGGLAAVLAVTGGASALVVRDHATQPQPADENAKPLTYAVGSVIHSGDTTVDVGVNVVTLVALGDRFVYRSAAGTMYVWRDGSTDELSHVTDAATRLSAEDDGALVAWTDGQKIFAWPGVRDNVNTFSGPDVDQQDAPHAVEALADGHLFLWDGKTTWIAEVPPLDTHAVWPDQGLGHEASVVDAAGDRILVKVGDGLAVVQANLLPPPHQAGWADWKPGTDLTGAQAQVPQVTSGDLAPDARYWFTTQGGFTVYDSRDASAQEPEHPGFAEVTPYQWLSSDTIAATGHRDGAPDGSLSILTCRVSTNTCTDALPDVGTADDVVLPSGPTTSSR